MQNPYQGLLVGEPLSAPFARPGTADWSSLTNGTVLSGQAGLNLTFSAAATNLPLARVDLFLDGNYIQTVTNLLPSRGNVLSATLNGVHGQLRRAHQCHRRIRGDRTGRRVERAEHTPPACRPTSAGDRLELQSLDVLFPAATSP